ncbi:hypothetical protein Nepgr_032789 [Nepenthes gracilis]|uniref:Ninja-family protein n=1 Tax=Nepenthes gracilis TaxID=150966 RepID=A0AAD3Y8K0_NEPGR|nr:hypothetical protein Nepgr_032789 [Nepenthes gracilis]
MEGENAGAEAANEGYEFEEVELELRLGLPFYGNSKKSEKGRNLDIGNKDSNLNGQIYGQKIEFDNVVFSDSQAERDIQALRRPEPKKNGGETSEAKNGNWENENGRAWFERQSFKARAMDRERREMDNEIDFAEIFRKTVNEVDNGGFIGLDFTLNPNCSEATSGAMGFLQIGYGGFLPPHFMPYFVGNGAGDFRPFQAVKNIVQIGGNDFQSEQSMSNCSRGVSSSDTSDYQSTAGQVCSFSDAGSHSCHSPPDLPHPNTPTLSNPQARSFPCQPELEPNGVECDSSADQTESIPNPNGVSCSVERPISPKKSLETDARRDEKPVFKPGSPSSRPLKEAARGDVGNPETPRIQGPTPCVSATGNGPNAKTITGFLHKYTENEVCIVCVCHGSSFSPAGFMEHAGGVDMELEHPLKHIRMIPSSVFC